MIADFGIYKEWGKERGGGPCDGPTGRGEDEKRVIVKTPTHRRRRTERGCEKAAFC